MPGKQKSRYEDAKPYHWVFIGHRATFDGFTADVWGGQYAASIRACRICASFLAIAASLEAICRWITAAAELLEDDEDDEDDEDEREGRDAVP
jgi:hypothetical protein